MADYYFLNCYNSEEDYLYIDDNAGMIYAEDIEVHDEDEFNLYVSKIKQSYGFVQVEDADEQSPGWADRVITTNYNKQTGGR